MVAGHRVASQHTGGCATKRKRGLEAWGIVGALGIAVAIGLPLAAFGYAPGLILARMVWALIVTYLLMAALFESFVYPFVIMISVPLAVVGGFAGLAIVHAWSLADPTKSPQQLDVLTMLGFVILIGVVVNNAILLVHQAINFMQGLGESDDDHIDPLPPLEAIRESVKTRIRPIFMSVLTSVGGMLPLVLFPGSGSEMYRGLGSVVVGGAHRLDRVHARARPPAVQHHDPGDGGAAGRAERGRAGRSRHGRRIPRGRAAGERPRAGTPARVNRRRSVRTKKAGRACPAFTSIAQRCVLTRRCGKFPRRPRA